MLLSAARNTGPPAVPSVDESKRAYLTRDALLRRAALSTSAAAMAFAHAAASDAIPPPEALAAPAVLYTPPSVTGASTPEQIALAEHLSAKGAKFYGAYWCSFCRKQREMFGAGLRWPSFPIHE